jgi:hypothetical protein
MGVYGERAHGYAETARWIRNEEGRDHRERIVAVRSHRLSRFYLVCIQKLANWVEIKANEEFYRMHMVDVPRIKFSRNADIVSIGRLWMGTV